MKARLFPQIHAADPVPSRTTAPPTIGDPTEPGVLAALDEIGNQLSEVTRDETFVPSDTASSSPAIVKQPPLPNRPKGRWFFAGVMICMLMIISVLLWNAFFRTHAFGGVTGRVVRVPPPWSGTVDRIDVQVGDVVVAGQRIATVQSREIKDQIARLTSELFVARADLQAEVARQAIRQQSHQADYQKSLADYYSLAGQLAAEQLRLQDLAGKAKRIRNLAAELVVSDQEYESTRLARIGLNEKVDGLRKGLEQLKQRIEIVSQPTDQTVLVKPKAARIEQLEAEIERLRASLNLRVVCAPASGRVIAVERSEGEYIEPTDSIIRLVRSDSLELKIYARQNQIGQFNVGQCVSVAIEPHDQTLRCRVLRVGGEFEEVPKNLETRFRLGERVLPIYLEPVTPQAREELTLGSVVTVPFTWSSFKEQFD